MRRVGGVRAMLRGEEVVVGRVRRRGEELRRKAHKRERKKLDASNVEHRRLRRRPPAFNNIYNERDPRTF